MTAPPQPGWYPDPQDPSRNHFWDGTTWNPHGPPVDYPPDPTPPTPRPQPKQRNAFAVAGLLLVGMVAVVAALAALLGNRHHDTTSSSGKTATYAAAPVETAAPKPPVSTAQLNRDSYRAISQRDFQILLKDPASHSGERIIIYGKVAQFDSVTGASTFRSSFVMGQPYNPPGENAIITAPDPAILADVVEGDQLTMYVEVAGTTTYESQIGGNVTVPTFTAYIVEPFKAK